MSETDVFSANQTVEKTRNNPKETDEELIFLLPIGSFTLLNHFYTEGLCSFTKLLQFLKLFWRQFDFVLRRDLIW